MFVSIKDDLLKIDTILRIVASHDSDGYRLNVVINECDDYGQQKCISYFYENKEDMKKDLSGIKFELNRGVIL